MIDNGHKDAVLDSNCKHICLDININNSGVLERPFLNFILHLFKNDIEAYNFNFNIHKCFSKHKSPPRLFPDASLVRASARESRSATQVAPLEISDS